MAAPELLFHYTSHASLIQIVENDTLWLTDLRYLNDATEYVYTLGLARQIVDELDVGADHALRLLRALSKKALLKETSRMLVSSLSEESDLLSQWRAYCPPGSGVSIGFDTKAVQKLAREHSGELRKARYDAAKHRKLLTVQLEHVVRLTRELSEHNRRWRPEVDPRDFAYADKTWKEIDEFAERFATQVVQMATFFKHPSFAEEREWRIVVPADIAKVTLSFRPGRSYLVPYAAIPLKLKETQILQQVMVGPSPHPELAIDAVRSFLVGALPYATEVRTSATPYRAW